MHVPTHLKCRTGFIGVCCTVLFLSVISIASANDETTIYDLRSQEENTLNERSSERTGADVSADQAGPDTTTAGELEGNSKEVLGDNDRDRTSLNVRIIEPNIPSRVGKRPLIDDEYYEVSWFTGSYKVDGFAPGFSNAVRATYLLESASFLELEYLLTKIDQRTLLSLGRSPVSDGDNVTATSLNYGLSLFNANLFFGNNRSLSSNLHLMAGIGRFRLGEQNRALINLGAGIRTLFNDTITLRLEVRSSFVDKNFLEPSDSFSHNIQINAGIGILF